LREKTTENRSFYIHSSFIFIIHDKKRKKGGKGYDKWTFVRGGMHNLPFYEENGGV
jgi:hypothetical protein